MKRARGFYTVLQYAICGIMRNHRFQIQHYAALSGITSADIRHHTELRVSSMRHHAESQDVEYAVPCGIVYNSGQ